MSNELKIRKIEIQDYKYINKWWVDQGFKPVSLEVLPMKGLGGLIIEKEKPIAVAYLYLTNSNMGYIDNLISDPKYVSKDRFDVIAKLMVACEKMAKDTGCLETWAMSNINGILSRCEALGYNVSDENYAIISRAKK